MHSYIGSNGYVRLTGTTFFGFHEQEGCRKIINDEQEGSSKLGIMHVGTKEKSCVYFLPRMLAVPSIC